MSSDTELSRAAEQLRNVTRLVVLSGAGISAESGIPTFRDRLTGFWANYEPEQLATVAAFRQDPGLVWGWYQWRRALVAQAQPNAAHRALVVLAERVPRLTVLTQNVDNLHERADRHILRCISRGGTSRNREKQWRPDHSYQSGAGAGTA